MRNRSPYPRLLWSDEELAGDGAETLSAGEDAVIDD